MITGELEYLYGKGDDKYEYDYFFKNIKKLFKKRTEKEKQEARVKRQRFFAQDGKANEIIGGVSSVLSFINPQEEEESDFEIGLGEQAPEPTTKKGIPKEVYIAGGIVIAIGGLWAYSHFKGKAISE